MAAHDSSVEWAVSKAAVGCLAVEGVLVCVLGEKPGGLPEGGGGCPGQAVSIPRATSLGDKALLCPAET